MTDHFDLQTAARAMQAAGEQGKAVAPVLKRLCPAISRQIVTDGDTPGLLSFWGRSANVDENVGQTIVPPAILQAIGQLAGVPLRGRFVHAGLQHTYGYLFSLIETPYGYKRDRWVSEEWERGFGIDRSLLGPVPRAGTLLANLTWFMGQVVYCELPRPLHALEQCAAAVAPELVCYPFRDLPVRRVVEQVEYPPDSGRTVQLFTDLVPYPNPPAAPDADVAVLLYSVQAGARVPPRLITAFPVREQMVQELTASASGRARKDVRLRYNAYLPGLYGKIAQGRRFLAR